MTLLSTLKSIFNHHKDTDPEKAYDVWAAKYDDQPDNLMLALDEIIFSGLLANVTIKNKRVLDVGCGTGRHWNKLFQQQPASLEGYDVSVGMLNILKQKFPDALVHHLTNNLLSETANTSIDLLISTLTIAHIRDAGAALKEWDRVTKPGADIIITDYHPAVLAKGGKRTFKEAAATVSVKNHIHTVESLKEIAASLNWTLAGFSDRKVDEQVRHFYEQQNALNVYEAFKGLPVIYGIHFKKQHDH